MLAHAAIPNHNAFVVAQAPQHVAVARQNVISQQLLNLCSFTACSGTSCPDTCGACSGNDC